MKRLIDEEIRPGTPDARLAELVRAASRFQPVPFRRQRVLAHFARRPPGAHRVFRASFATVLALGTAAAAAAAIQRPWVRNEPGLAPVVTAAPPARAEPPSRPARGPRDAVDEAPGLPAEMATTAPAPESPKHPLSVHNGSPRPGLKATPSADTRSRARGEEDPARVLDAIRTLRNGGDATRAAALLDDYLRAHPNGVLAEDALALSIEAADARHDRRAAAEYAARYVRQFPGGRFRSMAAQAVQRADP